MAIWQWLLFLPFVLHLAELIPFYAGPLENKVKEVNLILKYHSLIHYPSDVCYFSPQILATLKVIYTLLGAFISFVMVLYFIRNNSANRRFVLNWMLAYTGLSLLSIVFIIAYVMGIIGFNNLKFSYADLLMNLAAFLNLAVILYRPTLLDGSTLHSLVIRLDDQARQAEPGEDDTKLAKYSQIAERLETYFSQDKVFLNIDLSQEMVSTALQVSPRELSRTLVYMYDLNFPDFVNSWRIAYIVDQQRKNEDWRNYSQELLAESAGFGSRQTLNNATNRLYGLTSAKYFESKQENQGLSSFCICQNL